MSLIEIRVKFLALIGVSGENLAFLFFDILVIIDGLNHLTFPLLDDVAGINRVILSEKDMPSIYGYELGKTEKLGQRPLP